MKLRRYYTLDYPQSVPNSKTLLTGIRYKNKSYYITGFYETPEKETTSSFLYVGDLSGNGTWNILKYPKSSTTNLYGPNIYNKKHIQVVGNYTTNNSSALGCLYEGDIHGDGKWTTLIPTSQEPVLNTIAHSTMQELVVGNYSTENLISRAFIYDIISKEYNEITFKEAKSITAYGIWYNNKDLYTICGGYSNTGSLDDTSIAYLVDWNNKKKKLSNWRSFYYNNDPTNIIKTHFNGISSYCSDKYTLVGDYTTNQTLNRTGAFFAIVNGTKAEWSELSYPNSEVTSGNSVSKNVAIGVYSSPTIDLTVHGYVSK
jgi:hypothetical protein